MDDDLLAEQRAFYRRRAPEYDEWWQRRGRYDRGPDDAKQWDAEVAEVDAALFAIGQFDNVLELAGGTGWWTERLARVAGHLTVVDASPETLERNRARVSRTDVEYLVADLFAWRPRPAAHDLVFFSFWLSHVPRSRFTAFWETVAHALAPGGRVFFVDNRLDPTVFETDPYVVDEGDGVQRRRLADGSEHRVVKVFYEPDELVGLLTPLGWTADVRQTSRFFLYGTARRA